MLDDHASRFREAFDTFPCRIGIRDVVVGKLFALQLHSRDQSTRGWVQIAVEGCCLMRIFAIAQVLQLHKATIGLRRIFAARSVTQVVGRQIVTDGRVVIADSIERCH